MRGATKRKTTELADARDWTGAIEFVTASALYEAREAFNLRAKMLSAPALCDFALVNLPIRSLLSSVSA